MPGIGGLETIRRLKAFDPLARILAFTMHEHESMITHSISAGPPLPHQASGMGR